MASPSPGMVPPISPGSPVQPVQGLESPNRALGLSMRSKEESDGSPVTDINTRFTAFFTSKWEDLKTAYTVYHQLCWQNFLYYAGQLWIDWDKTRRIWSTAVPEDEWTPQPNVNKFAPAIDSITSIFQVPTVEAVPKIEDNMDAHDLAEVTNAVIEEFMDRNGLFNTVGGKESKGDHAGQLFTLAGNIFTIVKKKQVGAGEMPDIESVPAVSVSCPQCGLSDTLPPDHPSLQPSPGDMLMGQPVSGPSCPQCQGSVQQTPTTKTQQATDPITGKPATKPVIKWTAECVIGNPMFALPRAGSKSMEDCGYVWWCERLSLDRIFELWKYEAQPDNLYLDSMESSWEIAMNYYFTGYSNLALSSKESALVVIVYVEPNKVRDIPEGGVGVFINNQFVHYETWLDSCPAGHQLTHAGYLKMPTTFFFRTPAFDMAQIQKELSRYESIIALHAMTSASDSLIIDENTKVSNVTGRGDSIIYWRSIGPGSKEPHRLQHGSLDNGVYEQRQKLEDALQNISGAVDVWRGQQAGSVTAGNAISQLRGQAEQTFSKPTKNWQDLWVETIRKGVVIMQQVIQPWELAAIMGKGHDVQIAKWKGAKLDECLKYVATQHGLPRTRDEKRNDMLAMFDRGMLDITDPNVKIRISELFGETGMEQMFNRDATRARAENDAMTQGLPPHFMPDIEDLQVHFYVHSEFIKRLDFDQLEPPVQQAILEHALETKMALQQLIAMQQAAQGGAEPGGPTPPKPGEPQGGGPGGKPGSKGKPGAAGKPGAPAGKPAATAPGRPGPTNQTSVPTGPGNVGGAK